MGKFFKKRYKIIFIFFLLMFSIICNAKNNKKIKKKMNFIRSTIDFNFILKKNKKKHQSFSKIHKKYKINDNIIVIFNEKIITAHNIVNDINKNKENSVNLISLIKNGIRNFFIFQIYKKNNLNFKINKKNFCSNKNIYFIKSTFIDTIPATIKKILSNGYLKIFGKKKIIINNNIINISFSGIINKNYINKDNSIISTKISNIQIKYKHYHYTIHKILKINILKKFFKNFFLI